MSEGINEASLPPDVPQVFRWRADDGSEVLYLNHPFGYGGYQLEVSIFFKKKKLKKIEISFRIV